MDNLKQGGGNMNDLEERIIRLEAEFNSCPVINKKCPKALYFECSMGAHKFSVHQKMQYS